MRNGKILELIGDRGNRWTGGAMCPKGLSIVELLNSPYRLVQPMLKQGSEWKTISYAEAVDIVVDKLRQSRAKHGDKIAERLALTSPLWDCRESELAALMTMRTAGGVNVMPAGEVCISTASNVLGMLLGANTSTTTVNEIVNAKTLVLWGANISETYPPYTRWLDKARDAGVRILSVDCRKTPTSAWAADQLMPLPGTDGALALGAIQGLLLKTELLTARGWTRASPASSSWKGRAAVERRQGGASHRAVLGRRRHCLLPTLAESPPHHHLDGRLPLPLHQRVAEHPGDHRASGPARQPHRLEQGAPYDGGRQARRRKGIRRRRVRPAGRFRRQLRRLLNTMKKGNLDVLFLNSSYRRYPDVSGVARGDRAVGFVVHRGFFKTEEMDVADLFVPAAFGPESAGSHYGAEKQVVHKRQVAWTRLKRPLTGSFTATSGASWPRRSIPISPDPKNPSERFRNTVPSWKAMSVSRMRQSPDGLILAPARRKARAQENGTVFTSEPTPRKNGKIPLDPRLMGAFGWTPPKGTPTGRRRQGIPSSSRRARW